LGFVKGFLKISQKNFSWAVARVLEVKIAGRHQQGIYYPLTLSVDSTVKNIGYRQSFEQRDMKEL